MHLYTYKKEWTFVHPFLNFKYLINISITYNSINASVFSEIYPIYPVLPFSVPRFCVILKKTVSRKELI